MSHVSYSVMRIRGGKSHFSHDEDWGGETYFSHCDKDRGGESHLLHHDDEEERYTIFLKL